MKGSVLIVEDERGILLALEDRLSQEDILVMGYTSASKAIDEIRGGLQYNIALVDLSFDERCVIGGVNSVYSGWDVIRESQIRNPAIPVVLITGYDKPPNWNGYYWHKLSDRDALLRIVNFHLDKNPPQKPKK